MQRLRAAWGSYKWALALQNGAAELETIQLKEWLEKLHLAIGNLPVFNRAPDGKD